MKQGKRFLVTGGSGFIGRVLCERLRLHGWVRALVRRKTDGPWDEAVCHDLTTATSLEDAVRDIDTVFHLAGKTDDSKTSTRDATLFYRVNYDGTARLVEAAAASGVERLVYLSSIKAMGSGSEARLNESSPAKPNTPYGRSKRAAEDLVLGSNDVAHACVLRSSPVYGVGSKGNLARMIRAVARGMFPPPPDTGNVRSMVHVDDVVQALMLSVEKEEANGRVFIVTDGNGYSTRQIYEWICQALGRNVPSWRIPAALLRTVAKVGDGIGLFTGRKFVFDTRTYDKLLGSAHFDSTRIRDSLGYRPQWDLERALPSMVSEIENHA
ncbi:MAG: NAD-dependent epimerase/dehydratase family protein [Candidatus Latescibacterota bacterium]|nr:MAG: NAD-dependent epimerase/dehydratase family protein [Candidatus Latescibacterota bacterium]